MFCKDLPSALEVTAWRKRPVHKVPHNAARPPQPPRSATERMSATTQATGPDCWLDSFTLGMCDDNGVEVPCRLEYWECDDGSCFYREVLLAAPAGSLGSAPPPES
jgi:hypothetical protein